MIPSLDAAYDSEFGSDMNAFVKAILIILTPIVIHLAASLDAIKTLRKLVLITLSNSSVKALIMV